MKSSSLLLTARILAAVQIFSILSVWWLPPAGGRVALVIAAAAVIVMLIVLATGWLRRRQQVGAAACVGIGGVLMIGGLAWIGHMAADPYDASIPILQVFAIFVGLGMLAIGVMVLKAPEQTSTQTSTMQSRW